MKKLLFLFLLVPLLAMSQASTDYKNWTGSGNWSNSANWTNGYGYGQLEFKGSGSATSNNDNNPASQWRLYFSGGQSYTLTGNAVSLFDFSSNPSWILSDATVNQNLNLPISFADAGARYAWITTRNSGSLTFGGNVSVTGGSIVALRLAGSNTAGAITFNGTLTSSKPLDIGKDDQNATQPNTRVFLNGNNSGFTGVTTIYGGTLSVPSNTALGTNTLTLGSGATTTTLAVTGDTQRSQGTIVSDGSTAGVIDVASGKTFELTGVLSQTGSNQATKIGKSGAGTLTLTGAATYQGQLQIGQGTVIVNNNNGLGLNTSTANRGVDLGLNVGDVSEANNVSLLANNGITVGQSIFIATNASGATRTVGLNGSGSAVFNNEIFLGGDMTLNGSSGTVTLSGQIVNTSGVKVIGGTVVLSGNNTYTGATTISGGTLRLGADNRISSTSPIVLAGGTFSTGATTGFTDVLGTLNLTADSTIALGTGSHTLTFANSSGLSPWTGSSLIITGWNGTAGQSNTSGGKINVGVGGLTSAQLAKIAFTGYAGTPIILPSGELVPPGPSLAVTSGSLIHNTVCVGTAASTVTYTITNTGGNAAGVTVTSNSPEFVVSNLSSTTINGAGGTATYDVTFTPSAGGNRTATITINTATANGNTPVTSFLSGTANTLPTATISGTATACRNSAFLPITFTGSNGTAPYTFTYKVNGGPNQTVTASSTTVSIINSASTVGTFVYSLVSVQDSSSTTCVNPQSGSATITVNALPTASISGSTSVCQNATAPLVNFTANNGTAPYTFTYKINGGSNLTATTVSGNSVGIPAPTGTAGSFVYTLVSVADSDPNSCLGTQSGTVTINVNPLPTGTISGTATACRFGAFLPITFTGNNGTAPYTFTYKVNGGPNQTVTTSVSNSVSIINSASNVGTFVYTLVSVQDSSSSACINPQSGSATITVNPLPTASVSGSTTVCLNGVQPVITFTGSTGTAPYTFTYKINGGSNQTATTVSGDSVTVAVPTTTAGIYTYSLVSVQDSSSTSCSSAQSGSATITVNPLPTASISGTTTVCRNSSSPSVTFTGAAGTAPYSFTYQINGGTGLTVTTTTGNSVTVSVPTGTAGSYTYSLISVQDSSAATCANNQSGIAVVTVDTGTTYYADTDNDGFGDAGASVVSCTGQPSGYVTNSTDCAPSNAAAWKLGDFYTDSDNDGYNNGAPATSLCYGASTPAGYTATNIGTDCDDSNGEINTNHVEVPANGIDDNCDGTVDEAAQTTSIIASQCGATLSNINNAIYASQVPVAEGYRFEVTNGANVRTYDAVANSFTLLNLTGGVTFGTTYSIRVAVKTNGFWRSYFTACTVTTPAAPETTQVVATQCGTTLPLMSTTIYANQVTAASQYRFEVTNGSNVRTYDSAFNRFSLTNLTGTNTFGTTYIVRVALMIGGVWQDYGAACSITTPATPGYTNVSSPQCGSTITNSWTTIYANPIAGAQGYRFEVTVGATTRFYDTSVPRFSLRNIPSFTVTPNTAYTIRVAILYNSVYQGFGTPCTINTAAAITRQTATAVEAFAVKASPNPFASTFKLEMNTSSEDQVDVKVYDMIGKLIEARQIGVAEFGSLEVGERYPSGVYNIIVTQGENVKALRVIKR